MIKIDHFYKIGDCHEECQDYAMSRIWKNGLSFACITDGCSSSHNRCRALDIGARILALSAERVIKSITANQDDGIEFLRETFFAKGNQGALGDLISIFAKNEVSALIDDEEISQYALDSTLLFVVADEKKALVFVFGDGVVAVENGNGSKSIYEVSYSQGAPYYLSYLHNQNRQKRFAELGQEMSITDLEEGKCVQKVVPKEDCLSKFYTWSSIYVEDYAKISVMSDGFTSFQDSDGNSINSGVTVNQATGYKNLVGSFLQRRMKMMLKKSKAKLHTHYDDLSIATIVKVLDVNND